MAESVAIDTQGSEAKIRHPVAVAVLTLVTIGIYGIVWWYKVNREMVDLGRARQADGLGENATTSLLAMFPGGLVLIPPIVSLYNGIGRMQRAQELTLERRTLSGWVVLAVIVGGFIIPFLGLVAYGYMQAELNKVWENVDRAGVGELGAGQGGEIPAEHPAESRPAPPPHPTAS